MRYLAWFPVRVNADGNERVVLSRNLSQTGLLLSGPDRLAVGAPVTVEFRLSTDQQTRRISGIVVRTSEGEDDTYPYRMAVEFDDPVPELQRLIENAIADG